MAWVRGNSSDHIKFDPPLVLIRQQWILNTLTRECVTSVLDIGCGEGNLLQAVGDLSFPALTIPEPCIQEYANPSERDESELPSLHLRRIAGLDISEQALNRASEKIFPSISNPPGSLRFNSWTDIEIKLYVGDLTVFEKSLNGYEAIVLSEVIEHLPQPKLCAFGPVLLGKYKPRLLLVTTPNFSFNVRFGQGGGNKRGYLDPTGRTSRVFRNDDHQFEWTPEEFSSWAMSLSDKYGYTLEQSAIGTPTSSLPPPSKAATYAVHCCVFRLDPTSPQHQILPISPLSISRSTTPSFNRREHRLLRSALVKATLLNEQGVDFEVIREIVKDLMSYWDRRVVLISELWPELGIPCGGSRRVLVQALGGWGNVPPPPPPPMTTSSPECSYLIRSLDPQEFTIKRVGHDFEVQWNCYHPHDPILPEHSYFDSRERKEKRKEEGRELESSIPGWE